MTNDLKEYEITCPWCWERYSLWLESEAASVELIEDCQICCHPIQLHLQTDINGKINLLTERAM